MATQVSILGRVRGVLRDIYAVGDGQLGLGDGLELLSNQVLPERAEIVRMGNSYGAQIPTASAFTYAAAWPTTRAELLLYNGEDKGGKTYIIDRVWLANITATAAGIPIALLGQLVPAATIMTAVTDNTAVLRQSLSGKVSNYSGRVLLALAVTTLIANKWMQLGNGLAGGSTVTNIGLGCEANVYGKYLVPPGAAFGLAGIAGTAVGTAIVGVEWHEVQLNTL